MGSRAAGCRWGCRSGWALGLSGWAAAEPGSGSALQTGKVAKPQKPLYSHSYSHCCSHVRAAGTVLVKEEQADLVPKELAFATLGMMRQRFLGESIPCGCYLTASPSLSHFPGMLGKSSYGCSCFYLL